MPNFFRNFLTKVRDSIASTVYNKLYYSERAQQLTYLAMKSKDNAISEVKNGEREIIVSLTTHGRRLYEVHLAIESIMQGSIKPNRVILWLSKDCEHVVLPQTLRNQMERGLEVNFTEDIGPYTKLIPAIKEFPNSVIVTIDDDILYPYDTLELLLTAHRKYPNHICANRLLDIILDKQGNTTSLVTWKESNDKEKTNKLCFFEGVGGVLYPPQCFKPEVCNQKVFLDICPTADDVWFNCMALNSNTKIVPANIHYYHFPLLINHSVQDSALSSYNNKGNQTPNDKQLKAVLRHYNLSYGGKQ